MTATFHVGDAIAVMGTLPEKSVDLILTSPPFLALRSYLPADHPDKALEGGSQATPGMYIDWLIDVVEACDRVLAPHGSMCIELGDTYSGSGGGGGDYLEGGWREGQAQFAGSAASMKESNAAHWRQKNSNAAAWPLPKSLSLIPELFRLTLVYGTNPLTGRTTERWRLRNVVRWVRPNPPVGALGDKFRPATSELMVFCKSAKRYFDLDSVREAYKPHPGLARYLDGGYETGQGGSTKGAKAKDDEGTWQRTAKLTHSGAPPLDWWNIPLLEGEEETRYGPSGPKPIKEGIPNGPKARTPSEDHGRGTYGFTERTTNPLGSPPLDWWNIPPGGFSGAHYAVWPPELLIKPIKAMCPEKVCRQCGEPSRRIVESERVGFNGGQEDIKTRAQHRTGGPFEGGGVTRVITGESWSDCGHDDYRPGRVLDPFGGSGTTALVATGHGRDCILIDLDERNFDLALQRVGPFILEHA